ncbi:Uncharacterised protein [Mycobacterium tuberculosis]|nr:Uncharacterised protein [Mycobacterium tuberculosis]
MQAKPLKKIFQIINGICFFPEGEEDNLQNQVRCSSLLYI